ncbi:MAG TPA: cytochrome c3 family protein, partial [Blastocatellia bacterium]|nr:cytochrome c3 family protein [Blastocatellia bacterium]
SKQISETCLTCHAGKEEHNNYRRGEHWRNDVGCTDCHSPHGAVPSKTDPGSMTLISTASAQNPDSSTLKLVKASQPQLCLKCHAEMKAQFSQPFHHKVPEGTMKCSDCHNPHGGFELKQTRLATGADATCLKCHKDKQGPFVFEHAPLKTEGCVACHTPHGSGNPKLLKRNNVNQLCLECHSSAGEIGAPNTPSFHNQATARFQNCTSCHVKIHGSQTHQFFFR